MPLFVTAKSQVVATGVEVVVLLVREFVAETDEVAVIVVAGTVAATFTTTTIFADAFEAKRPIALCDEDGTSKTVKDAEIRSFDVAINGQNCGVAQ